MPHAEENTGWERIIRDMIARNTASAPTEPGVYRMPCGNCYVDFFYASDGTERWLVPGDERSYTRDTVAIARHGDYPWERMYTLAHAAAEIRRRATAESNPDWGFSIAASNSSRVRVIAKTCAPFSVRVCAAVTSGAT